MLGIAPRFEAGKTKDMRATGEQAINRGLFEADGAALVVIVEAISVRGDWGCSWTLVPEPASVAMLAEA
jgi:hypothetical protein